MRLRGAVGLALVALSLTVAMAFPVLQAPDSRLFGWEIVGRHQDPFIVIGQFEQPRPLGLFTQPATDYLGAAIAAMTGSGVMAYNAVVLATFPLAALFAYLLAFALTRSRPASWLAGLLYAFAPFHIAQSAYHPHGAQTQWLPLYLLALWWCLERASGRRLLLLGSALALVASSNFYYGLMAGILTPFALLGFWLVQRQRADNPPAGLRKTMLALAALAAAGVCYALVFAPSVITEPDRLAFPRSDLDLYGAKSSSYLIPPIGHPLLGSWVEQLWKQRGPGDVLEQQITVGLGLLLLSLVALGFYLKGERDRELAAVPVLVLIAAVAWAFSLAPVEGSAAAGPARVLRPSEIVYGVLPMFRAYARFGVLVLLAATVLASAGALRLLRSVSKPARALGIGLIALCAVELIPFPPFRWRDVLPTSAHRFLAGREGPIRLLDCASPDRTAERPFLYRFAHPISLRSGNGDCADPDYPVKLANEGFTHLLVRKRDVLGFWLERQPAPVGTHRMGHFDDALLFALDPPSSSRVYLEFVSGFHWREFLGDETYRWMTDTGALAIVNPGAETVQVELALEFHSFPAARTIDVELDNRRFGQLEVSTEPAIYALPTLSIAPGRHLLSLIPDSGAVVADSVLGNGDSRELSVALWGWTVRTPAGGASAAP